MHVYRAENGASQKEQCVNADLEDHCQYYIVHFFVQGILLSQNTSSNKEVAFILFILM